MSLILSGGFTGSTAINTILEYDITGDSYTQIGTMTQARSDHAISVVKFENFAEHCDLMRRRINRRKNKKNKRKNKNKKHNQ